MIMSTYEKTVANVIFCNEKPKTFLKDQEQEMAMC